MIEELIWLAILFFFRMTVRIDKKLSVPTKRATVVLIRVKSWKVLLRLVLLFTSYLLTYSMVQSPSWEANWSAASQEIPRISRNLNVHYRTHKRPPPVSILGQPNSVHIPTSHLLEIHPNIIHPSMPRSPQLSPSLRFPHSLVPI